jgi:hypothetical protein
MAANSAGTEGSLEGTPGVGVLEGGASPVSCFSMPEPSGPSGEEAANLVVGQMIDAPVADIPWGMPKEPGNGFGLLWMRAQGFLELENLDFFDIWTKSGILHPHFLLLPRLS